MLNLVQRATPTAPTPAPAAQTSSDAVPQTPLEYNALLARQAQLRNQYGYLQGQRSDIARRLTSRINSDAYHAGLDAQLQAIDAQILQVDASLARTGQLLAQAPASALPTSTLVPPPLPPSRNNNFTPADFLLSLSIVFVLFPLTIGFVRRMWRGSARPSLPPRFEETPSRLERIEGALETVAIEVERISESQRFMTRLMTETQLGSNIAAGAKGAPTAKALGPGERPFEAVRVREDEPAGVSVPARDGH